MFRNKTANRSIALACALSLSVTALGTGTLGIGAAQAQTYGNQGYGGQNYYSQSQIDQLVAPIALYPDPLLAQMLAASAYPNEIADAHRFVSRNQDPYTLDRQPWDYSVKAVARYPEALNQLNADLNWTAALGTAYINQPDAVANSIQRWRAQAYSLGNLYNTPQQTVYVEDNYVRIIPARPEMIYVPVYQPQVVYVQRYRPDYVTPFITFGLGLLIGSWLDKDWDWRQRRVYYNDRNRWESGRPVFYPQYSRLYIDRNREWRPETTRYRPPLQPIYPTRLERNPVPLPPADVRPINRDRDGDRDRDRDSDRRNDRNDDRRDRDGTPGPRTNLGNQGDPTSTQPGPTLSPVPRTAPAPVTGPATGPVPGQVRPTPPPAGQTNRPPVQVDRGRPNDGAPTDRGTIDRGPPDRGQDNRGRGGPAVTTPSNPPPAPRSFSPPPVQPNQPARPPAAVNPPEPKPQGRPPAREPEKEKDKQKDSRQLVPAPSQPQAATPVDRRPAQAQQTQGRQTPATPEQVRSEQARQGQGGQGQVDRAQPKADDDREADRRGNGRRGIGIDIN